MSYAPILPIVRLNLEKKKKISVRMPSDVRILHIPKSQFASQVCGSLRSPIIYTHVNLQILQYSAG